MKIAFLTTLIFFAINGFAQTSPNEVDALYPNPFEYQIIDSATGTKEELYDRAYQFIVTSFKSATNVLQMQDKSSGRIIAKGNMTIRTMTDGWGKIIGDDYVEFTISISVKDGRAKCILSNFTHKNGYGAFYKEFGSLEPSPEREISKRQKNRYYLVKTEVDSVAKSLLESFSSSIKKVDNW